MGYSFETPQTLTKAIIIEYTKAENLYFGIPEL